VKFPLRKARFFLLVGVAGAAIGNLLILGAPAPAQQPPTTRNQQIQALIQQLADPDPQRRREAEIALTSMGAAARAPLLAATRNEDPSVATAASRIMLTLPWSAPEDSPEVKSLLSVYGNMPEASRIGIVGTIAKRGGNSGKQALLRLIQEEPSDDVCWSIVTQFRDERDPAILEAIRAMNPPDDRSAALTLMGNAWRSKDRDKAAEYYRRAIELETRRPTFDDDELDSAFELLATDAILKSDFDAAAAVRRRQAARVGITRSTYPRPIYDLFILHGFYGPLNGFDADVQTFGDYLSDPVVLYCLSQAYGRQGRAFEAEIMKQAAKLAGLTSTSFYRAGLYLATAGWTEPARQQGYSSLAYPSPSPMLMLEGLSAIDEGISARRLLASLAANDELDAPAVEHLNASIALIEKTNGVMVRRNGLQVSLDLDEVRSQVALHEAKMARQVGDDATFRKKLDQIVAAAPIGSDIVLGAYPLLKAAGRDADAQALFERAYDDLKLVLKGDPADPEVNNNLAWLCARCGEKLPEALEMSQRAVEAEPDNGAYVDTLAEVHFRMGNSAQAAALEERAVKFRPTDQFMRTQLERFRPAGTP
jgi:tetratricopeptide (TPR) repeat protein